MNESSVWVMQYYGQDNELLTWPYFFSSPEEGERCIGLLNRDKLVGGRDPISVAWYKRVIKNGD